MIVFRKHTHVTVGRDPVKLYKPIVVLSDEITAWLNENTTGRWQTRIVEKIDGFYPAIFLANKRDELLFKMFWE